MQHDIVYLINTCFVLDSIYEISRSPQPSRTNINCVYAFFNHSLVYRGSNTCEQTLLVPVND